MGLGVAQDVALAAARSEAEKIRQMAKRLDPIEARRQERRESVLASSRAMTFKSCAEAYIAAHAPSWRHERHSKQWRQAFELHCYGEFGELPVQEVDLSALLKVIEPLWAVKTETASRLRQRGEAVLDWATVKNYRAGDNPARWKGHLDKVLPARTKVRKVRHHPALPYAQVGAFVEELRKREGRAARALEFAILTATRTNEAVGATWAEIDLDNATWTIAADRMKADREHRVPLPRQAVELLRQMKASQPSKSRCVFPAKSRDVPLSKMSFLMTLRRMEKTEFTPHGFRSSFRDWAAERTTFPREVVEAALAHVVADKTEAAYLRSDLFQKRRRLMQGWADHCQPPARSHAVRAELPIPYLHDNQ